MSIYEGYSWSLTQHLGRIADSNILYELLKAGHYYRNFQDREYHINNHLSELKLLPPNMRNGKSDIWRDYQQILPEIGLMMSTRYKKTPELTNLGFQWLDKEVSFENLITNQALRYQYPNGYKLQMPKGFRKTGEKSRAEIDHKYGILIKPGTLILRTLIEVNKSNEAIFKDKSLGVDEVALSLLPIKRNSDWQSALDNLKNARNSTHLTIDSRIKRHIQEWFRFLNYGNIFELGQQRLRLTSTNSIEELEEICNYHENIDTFWSPIDFQNLKRLQTSWFDYYGNISIDNFWVKKEEKIFVKENPEEFINDGSINLVDFVEQNKVFRDDIKRNEKARKFNYEDFENNSILHEIIVNELNLILKNNNFLNFIDTNSIDLYSKREDTHIIFEVKTVSPKNLMVRIRLGIGQLLEYRYRMQISQNIEPQSYLVINGNFILPLWVKNYLMFHLKVGLILRKSKDNFEMICDPFNNNFFD
ncbi:hypothetical protein [Exiguobacterium sp. KJ 601]|uniref:hypothetical protein n=1 Tax=Exiguobacterium sp. KJ 601 TaxID=2782569 RepID=UPI0022AF1040|nr:hypothetical protein [Exiguobacterium sp. KJ 601]